MESAQSDRRISERVTDDSILLICGHSTEGVPFSIASSINDISLGGVSFLTNIPIAVGSMLELSICSRRIRGLIFSIHATVLRSVRGDNQDFLVAAGFEGEFVQVGRSPNCDEIALQLREAVKVDEQARRMDPSR